MNEKIVKYFIDLNKKASENGDVPVSCVITKNNKIIAKAYNKKYKNNDPFAHAEILAIKKASKKLKTSNLNNCQLYVTLEPCEMCINAINEARIKKVYYILKQEKHVNINIISEQIFENQKKYFKNELQKFFLNKR